MTLPRGKHYESKIYNYKYYKINQMIYTKASSRRATPAGPASIYILLQLRHLLILSTNFEFSFSWRLYGLLCLP